MASVGDRPAPVTLFYSYSHKDEALRDRLDEQLAALKRSGLISSWHDRAIAGGADWKTTIDAQLDAADVILLLISPSFIASDYCSSEEMTRALARHVAGDARVIPVILRPCLWKSQPFAQLQVVPKDGKAVTQWSDPDEAFLDIATAIQRAAEDLRRHVPSSIGSGSNEPARRPDPARLPDLSAFREIDAAWCPEMIVLPAGEFLMGCPREDEQGHSICLPQHRVRFAYRFAVGRTPVTFDEFDRFCAATSKPKPVDSGWGRGRRPVINVTWHDAKAYCSWLADTTQQPYRLLTESEWEYACRAGTTTRYAFGDSISTAKARYGLSAWSTVEVGQYPPNLWGLFDMHGNVAEWVEDVWHDKYTGAPGDGTAWLQNGDADRHVVRGGGYSWAESGGLRSYFRASNKYMEFQPNVGFRVARTL